MRELQRGLRRAGCADLLFLFCCDLLLLSFCIILAMVSSYQCARKFDAGCSIKCLSALQLPDEPVAID